MWPHHLSHDLGLHQSELSEEQPSTEEEAPKDTAMTDQMRQLRDAWLNSDEPLTPEGLATFITQHPDLAAGVTITGEHRDQLLFPDGTVIDLVLSKMVEAIIMEADDLDLK